tara:strand:+ start:2922 stop:3596 length:675 start_codon:yes stop_codon:yes gene_type:complete
MLFKIKPKSKIAYTFFSGNEARALFKPPKIINNVNAGCPAQSTIHNRLVALYPAASFKIEIYFNAGQPFYKYEIDTSEHPEKDAIHNYLKDNILLENPKDNILDLQLFLNYAIITDDKELEMTTLPPYEMKTKNAEYVYGSFYPYSWVRPINSVWYVQDKTVLEFNKEIPATYLLFNKPVSISYVANEGKIANFLEETKNVTSYAKKINKLYPNVLSRRPKKLL